MKICGARNAWYAWNASVEPCEELIEILCQSAVGKRWGTLPAQELQTESAYRFQFMVELAPRLLCRQALKKIGQLGPTAHNRIGLPLPKVSLNVEAIVSVVEMFHCFGGTEQPTCQ